MDNMNNISKNPWTRNKISSFMIFTWRKLLLMLTLDRDQIKQKTIDWRKLWKKHMKIKI